MNEKLRFPFFTFLLTALYTLKGMIEHRLKQTLTNRKCVCLNKKRSLWGLLPEAFKWFPLNVWSPEENLKCHYEISIGCFIICAHFSCGSSLDDIYTFTTNQMLHKASEFHNSFFYYRAFCFYCLAHQCESCHRRGGGVRPGSSVLWGREISRVENAGKIASTQWSEKHLGNFWPGRTPQTERPPQSLL